MKLLPELIFHTVKSLRWSWCAPIFLGTIYQQTCAEQSMYRITGLQISADLLMLTGKLCLDRKVRTSTTANFPLCPLKPSLYFLYLCHPNPFDRIDWTVTSTLKLHFDLVDNLALFSTLYHAAAAHRKTNISQTCKILKFTYKHEKSCTSYKKYNI